MSPLLAFNVTAATAAASQVRYRCFSTSSSFSFFFLHLFLFFLLPSSSAPPSLPLLPPFLTHQNTSTHRCTMYRYPGTDQYIPIWQVSETGLPETAILPSYVHILKKEIRLEIWFMHIQESNVELEHKTVEWLLFIHVFTILRQISFLLNFRSTKHIFGRLLLDSKELFLSWRTSGEWKTNYWFSLYGIQNEFSGSLRFFSVRRKVN